MTDQQFINKWGICPHCKSNRQPGQSCDCTGFRLQTAVDALIQLALAAEWCIDLYMFEVYAEKNEVCSICGNDKIDGHDPDCLFMLARLSGLLPERKP